MAKTGKQQDRGRSTGAVRAGPDQPAHGAQRHAHQRANRQRLDHAPRAGRARALDRAEG